ncbi:hypothetical protein [Dethiothermospora halolimnae]|uniref:hypothetical protein n=1 Tax=Dethiothermospora halolimnae TaxID=3114390 RepID=UPI003CCB8027
MEIFANEKGKKIIAITITLVSILELAYFSNKSFKDYRKVYDIGFLALFIVQPIAFISLYNGKKSYLKIRMISFILLMLIIPTVIYISLPNYTYSEGKEIVKNEFERMDDIVFINKSIDKSTVPVKDSGSLFVDRSYYYEIKYEGNNIYYIVDPLKGRAIELEEKYWLN